MVVRAGDDSSLVKKRSLSIANDNAGKPIGFGDVLFSSVEEAAPVVFAPMGEASLSQEAFLA